MRQAPFALALLFLLGHIFWLPPTFDDIDAVNFGLGVRTFDVAAHQPHPPGYPVYIAAAKLVTPVVRATGVQSPEPKALALLGVLAGALAIPALLALFTSIVRDRQIAMAATAVTVVNPVYWFTALRPLSDVPGLCLALAAQALLVRVLVRPAASRIGTWLVAGAAVAGLAIGVRSQSFILTLPLLALAVLWPNRRTAAPAAGPASSELAPGPRVGPTLAARVAAVAAVVFACLLWAVPLVIVTGGIDAYLSALGDQAGEDFVGSAMLWTNRSPRAAVAALQHTLLWPWGCLIMGVIVTAAAVAGFVRMAVTHRTGLAVLLAAFAPYAIFHLLFQETVMVRYALPLVPAMALLAGYGIAWLGRPALWTAAALFAAVSAWTVLPASRAFGGHDSPGARAIMDAVGSGGGEAIGMHAVMLRHERWYHDNASGRVRRARHGAEVLSLVDHWRQTPDQPVVFLADPRRTDLAMLDERSRQLVDRYEWGFAEMPLMGGARPNRIERYLMQPPGWMLDQGWAVTAEVSGQSFRAGARPELRASTAWIRSRAGAATLVIGGRHLGPRGGPPARIEVTLPGGWVQSWEVAAGFFVRTFELPPGTLASTERYVPLTVTAAAVSAGEIRVGLEQFDLQSHGVPMLALEEGWQEPEYNPQQGRSWHWMGSRATMWVRQIGRDVALTLRGESPLVYFERPPRLRVSVGGTTLSELSPDADFNWTVTLPAAKLAEADGRVVVESDLSFVPGGNGDQRQLSLRLYSVRVD